MKTYRQNQNDLLRWYLLLWVSLVSLWGLFEISNRTVLAAWRACVTGSGLAVMCDQLKQHLGPQGQPDIAMLPPVVLATLLWHATLTFALFLLLYGVLLWFSLSAERKQRFALSALLIQAALTCVMGLFVPALSVTVPVSLLLVLILEACAVFKQVRAILAFSCAAMLCFLLIAIIAEGQGLAFSESSLTILIALALLVAGFLFVGGFFVLYTRLTSMHSAIETAYLQLEAANERIEALTLTAERQRMARELHDTLAQGLAGIILQLGVVHARIREQQYDGVQTILEQTLAAARDTLANARGAIDDLRMNAPSASDLVRAVREEIQHFTLTTGVPCSSEIDPLSQVPQAHTGQITGVIHEGLTNVARHAHASHAWVRASVDKEALCLEIGDDGVGFDPTRADMQPGHYGLLGMYERARLVEGQLVVLSAPGQGTRIQLSLRKEKEPARESAEVSSEP